MALHLHAVEWQVSVMYGSPKRSALLSGLLHAAAIVAVLTITSVKNPSVILKPVTLVGRDIGRYLASVSREKVGGGGGGTTTDSALSLIGNGVNEKEVREDRGISQATGDAGPVLPEEFRAGLDEYFNRLERSPARD